MKTQLLFASLVAAATFTFGACSDPAETPADDAGSSSSGGETDAGGCGFGEPNDTPAQATKIELDTTYRGLCSNVDANDAYDYFEFTAPKGDNYAGGYVQVTIDHVTDQGTAEFVVYSTQTNESILDVATLDYDASITGWLTVAPGVTYRVGVVRTGGAGAQYGYDLRVSYTNIVDAHEPNNDAATATPLVAGTPLEASVAAVSASHVFAAADAEDWYKVELTAGAKIVMSNVPADTMCEIELLDPSGEPVDGKYTTDPGGSCELTTSDRTGTYYVKQHGFASMPPRSGTGAPPASITGHYTIELRP